MTFTEYVERAIVGCGHVLETEDFRDWRIPGRVRARSAFLQAWDMDRINRNVLERAQRFRPDIVLVNGGWTIHPRTVSRIKTAGCPVTVNWIADYPLMFDKYLLAGPGYDHFFTSGTDSLFAYQGQGHKNGGWLPFACDPQIHRPVELSQDDLRRYACDICFVGSCYEERVEVLERLTGFDLAVWGAGWDKLPKGSALRKFVRGGSLTPDQWVKAFGAAKIVLNIIGHRCGVMHPFVPEHEFRMTNTKVFEILGCGAFQMVDAKADAMALFKDREHLVFYRDADHLAELARFYLDHPQERERISAAGRAEVLRKHTYTDRIKELVSVVTGK